MAQPEPSGQIADDGLNTRPKTPGRHLGGPFGGGHLATGRAAQSMLPVLGHFGLDRRNLAHLVAHRIRVIAQQEVPALAAGGRTQFDYGIDVLRRQEFPGASLMAGLTSSLTTA